MDIRTEDQRNYLNKTSLSPDILKSANSLGELSEILNKHLSIENREKEIDKGYSDLLNEVSKMSLRSEKSRAMAAKKEEDDGIRAQARQAQKADSNDALSQELKKNKEDKNLSEIEKGRGTEDLKSTCKMEGPRRDLHRDDQKLAVTIDKASELFNRNNAEIERISNKYPGSPVNKYNEKDAARVNQLKYTNSVISDIVKSAIEERDSNYDKAASEKNELDVDRNGIPKASDSLSKIANERQGRVKLISPQGETISLSEIEIAREALEISSKEDFRFTAEREIAEKLKEKGISGDIAKCGEDFRVQKRRAAKEKYHKDLEQLEKDYGKIEKKKFLDKIKDIEKDKKEDKRKGENRVEDKIKNYEKYNYIYKNDIKCDDPKYREFEERRKIIEREYKKSHDNWSDDYREVLNKKSEQIAKLEDKMDKTLYKILQVQKESMVTLTKNEIDYMKGCETIINLRAEHNLRMNDFLGDRIEYRNDEKGLAYISPRAATNELRSIIDERQTMYSPEDSHLLFERITNFLDKSVPFNSIESEIIDDIKEKSFTSSNSLSSISDSILKDKSDNNIRDEKGNIDINKVKEIEVLSPLELRAVAEKIRNECKQEMIKNGCITSKEIIKSSLTKQVFDGEGRLSNEIKRGKEYVELEIARNSINKEVLYERGENMLDKGKNYVLKSFDNLLTRTEKRKIDTTQKDLNNISAERNDLRLSSLKESFKRIYTNLRQDYKLEVEKKSINEIIKEKTCNWLRTKANEYKALDKSYETSATEEKIFT